jgi:uroporphyrinogen decarboxylase
MTDGYRSSMSSRERVLAAARRQVPDRIPRVIELEKAVHDRLVQQLGSAGLAALLQEDIVGVAPAPTRLRQDYRAYFSQPEMTWDEWGRGRIWDALGQYAAYYYPLERAETVDEILRYLWPDLDAPYRYADLENQVAQGHAGGYAVYGYLQETVFEVAWQLRSMDRLFEDISHQDEKAVLLLDRITECRVAAARAYARAGVDVISLGDDVAMQNRLLMSRRMWRSWFQPRLQQVIDAARAVRPDVLIEYHSDGKLDDLVGDLQAAGVDILNPVQPECIDHAWVKAAFGDLLAFSGGLGVQSVLPFGTAEEVREHTRKAIRTLGAGGGYIVGPSHVVERDVPLENIFAMIEAIHDFGNYS